MARLFSPRTLAATLLLSAAVAYARDCPEDPYVSDLLGLSSIRYACTDTIG